MDEITVYIEKMREIHENILNFIDDDHDSDTIFKNLLGLFTILLDQYGNLQLKPILYMILNISNNHKRSETFFTKIERILLNFKEKIKQTLSNQEIFDFFKSNKRIILFLIKEKMMIIDSSISRTISETLFEKVKYSEYFSPENGLIEKNDELNMIENFEENRLKGENPDYLCELIRNDSINDFIIYVNKTNIYLDSEIKPSIFETNSFLLDKNPTLIEYSAFYGSIQIFKYLFINNVKIQPILWLYTIHGRNAELIHFLEENRIVPDDKSYEQCLKESIKCHHNEIANYFECNFIDQNSKKKKKFNDNIKCYAFRYHNYFYFPDDMNTKFVIYYLFQYDYFYIVKFLLENNKIDFNNIISNNLFFSNNVFKLIFFKCHFNIFLITQQFV